MSDSNIAGSSEDEIQAKLQETRDLMASTIDQLMTSVSPATQAKRAAWTAQDKAQDFKAFAQTTLDDAKEGDREAIKRIAIAAGAAVVVGVLWAIRRS